MCGLSWLVLMSSCCHHNNNHRHRRNTNWQCRNGPSHTIIWHTYDTLMQFGRPIAGSLWCTKRTADCVLSPQVAPQLVRPDTPTCSAVRTPGQCRVSFCCVWDFELLMFVVFCVVGGSGTFRRDSAFSLLVGLNLGYPETSLKLCSACWYKY